MSFVSPDPFAVLTVDGYQTKSTAAAKKTLNPYWMKLSQLSEQNKKENSVLTIQVFDQKKFKKKDQGFLGVVNIRISDVLGNVNDSHSSRTREETITRELKRSNDNLAVSGRLILVLSRVPRFCFHFFWFWCSLTHQLSVIAWPLTHRRASMLHLGSQTPGTTTDSKISESPFLRCLVIEHQFGYQWHWCCGLPSAC